MYFRTQAKIDLDAVEYNYNSTRAKLPQGCKLLGVIKADAYGHGAVELARFLENKCDFFGVACIEEAVELKKADIKTPILILGYVAPAFYDLVVKYDIRIPVFSYDTAKALSDEAVKQGKTVPFHFCIDTGMSRIGFQVNEESADVCKQICTLPNIEAEGLFSHFATADESDLTKALAQREKYKAFVEMLKDRGIQIPIKHLNNSAGIMNFDEYFDMCRMGIILYGLYPSEEVDKSLLDIKPVMSWLTHISHIKTLEAGREVSYGGTFKTTEPRVIATIPVGYADGYPRCLSNKGRVIINGQYAPIVGRVCMDQFMVDVTDVDGAELDSIVTLVGKDGDAELSMEEVSNAAYSFNYELPCRVARRVPRTYYKDGKFIKATNYMY
ncbi:alanine racemase [uncultured Eubacterium sp.]|uniref:alanine racemase n=1 Tax=uncultured Eubacterium sp. TaxID=165185 RepID=UPI002614FD24|nr:alanine racemase [uncultured Eubacterium sp.]